MRNESSLVATAHKNEIVAQERREEKSYRMGTR